MVLQRNRSRAVTAREQLWTQRYSHMLPVILGSPSRALPLSPTPGSDPREMQFLETRFVDGDSAAGEKAGAALEAAIGTPVAAAMGAVVARFAGGQRALDQGKLKRAERAIEDLRGLHTPPDSGRLHEAPEQFALLLETQLASARHSSELPKLLDRLDSALVDATVIPFTIYGNLVVSRLFEQQGNLPRALAAIRRRVFDLFTIPAYVTYHREEGRLAALNGDREGAIMAYRRYLALRSGAEPRLQPQVAQVRAELEALERESTDK